jgi:hypothetical protein
MHYVLALLSLFQLVSITSKCDFNHHHLARKALPYEYTHIKQCPGKVVHVINSGGDITEALATRICCRWTVAHGLSKEHRFLARRGRNGALSADVALCTTLTYTDCEEQGDMSAEENTQQVQSALILVSTL